jgi:hypothetical protein
MIRITRTERVRGAIAETLAMGLIGQAAVAMAMPRRHVRLWRFGPRWYRRLVKRTSHRPLLVRTVAAFEFALGMIWVYRITQRSAPDRQRRKKTSP